MKQPRPKLSIAERQRRQLLATRAPLVRRTLTAADLEAIRAMIAQEVALKMSGIAAKQRRGGCG